MDEMQCIMQNSLYTTSDHVSFEPVSPRTILHLIPSKGFKSSSHPSPSYLSTCTRPLSHKRIRNSGIISLLLFFLQQSWLSCKSLHTHVTNQCCVDLILGKKQVLCNTVLSLLQPRQQHSSFYLPFMKHHRNTIHCKSYISYCWKMNL